MINILVKNKKTYLMIAGTLLPAIALHQLARLFGAGQTGKNLAAVTGLIIGGIATSKMLKG